VVITTLFLSIIYWLELISWNLFLLLIAVIPFAFIGDYFESQLKRNQQIKDSGSLIPGHGGIWDRLDSHMAIIPVFAALSSLVL
jgi:phosphatidate cytidylyltransferase